MMTNRKSYLLSLFAIDHVSALPILASGLAGSGDSRVDLLGRDLSLSEPPKPVYFMNARRDDELSKDKSIRLDYVLGDSDPEGSESNRLSDRTLVYWRKAPVLRQTDLHEGAAVIVSFEVANRFENEGLGASWYCLRRVSFDSLNSADTLNKDEIFIRTMIQSELDETRIKVSDIAGRVIAFNKNAAKASDVVTSGKLPI